MRSWRQLRAVALACSVTAAVMIPLSADASACESFHGRGHLTGFPSNAGSLFYSAREGDSATATISVTAGDCAGLSGQVNYSTEDAVATAPVDYAVTQGQTALLCQDVHPMYCDNAPPSEPVTVPTQSDSVEEAAVESFWFRLTSGTNGLADPSSVPIHIVDSDGGLRASLEPTVDGAGAVTYSRSESYPKILIPVFLAGPSGGSVGYSVIPDPLAPASPGEDFQILSPNPLPIGQSRVGFIELGIVNDELGEGPESVVITLMGPVAALASTTFTILDNEENVFPTSKFHHPRHNWRYAKTDYRIREIHVFATDEGGSGVVGADLALRRNLMSGACRWLTKEGWEKKECSNRQWLGMKYDDVGELFYYRHTKWKASVGTRIKNYTAFSRAIDGAGNVEKEFKEKRNANTFEVKRPKG